MQGYKLRPRDNSTEAVPASGVARVSMRQLPPDVEGDVTMSTRLAHQLYHIAVCGVHHIEAVDVGDLIADLQPPV